MSVSLLSGYLKSNQPEAFKSEVSKHIKQINALLNFHNLDTHFENPDAPEDHLDILTVHSIHDLRKLAIHICNTQTVHCTDMIPEEMVEAYYEQRPDTLNRVFDHFIFHGDAQGYYLPMRLPFVLESTQDLPAPFDYVGSTESLLEEMRILSYALERKNEFGQEKFETLQEDMASIMLACHRSIESGSVLMLC
jgi:hypothetical protein